MNAQQGMMFERLMFVIEEFRNENLRPFYTSIAHVQHLSPVRPIKNYPAK